jgi:hypothetical protein
MGVFDMPTSNLLGRSTLRFGLASTCNKGHCRRPRFTPMRAMEEHTMLVWMGWPRRTEVNDAEPNEKGGITR